MVLEVVREAHEEVEEHQEVEVDPVEAEVWKL